jgi:hypothetical protein
MTVAIQLKHHDISLNPARRSASGLNHTETGFESAKPTSGPSGSSRFNFRIARHTLGTSCKMLTSVSLVILKVFPELRPGPTELAADENFVPAGHCAVRNAVAIRHMAG